MQVVEHPLLGRVREALLARGLPARTSDESGATPILVRNVERKIELHTRPDAAAGRPFGLYGNRFAAAPIHVVISAARRIDRPDFSNIIAMAAPSGGEGEYTDDQIARIFTTAFTAFAAAVQESGERRAVVHSGFWGCGAFGGNRRLMVALQVLASNSAGINRLVLHAGDSSGSEEAKRGAEVAEGLVLRCGSPTTLGTIVSRTSLLGYRWGVSDGN